ncbi:MAG: redoxin domain-containing protein [Pseudomonadota bacterium]
MKLPAALIALIAGILATTASAGTRVDNFRLLDQDRQSHELYYHNDATAVVFLVQANGCPIARNLLTDYRALRDTYADKGVRFAMINASLQDTREAIRAEAEEFGIDMPILVDETQLIGEALELDRSGEVLVIDPRNWEVAYRGPLSDRVGYETQKKEATATYLADALDSVIAGEPIAEPRRDAVGCIINFPERERVAEHAEISYSETIAPLLQERCTACHRPGGIGPWAMTSYEMIRGFAPMIREVVRTRRMPPWEVATDLPEVHASRALTVDEKRTLIHWIEAGAPRGDGPDPLKSTAPVPDAWPLGEPDLVVTAPAFTVPATGIVDYQFPAVPNPLENDVWVRAVSIKPGNGKVVHHVLIGTTEEVIPDGDEDRLDAVFSNYLMGYAPGAESYVYPEGTGVLVKQGGQIHLQMHYTPYGVEATDETQVALYFHDEAPKHHLRQQVVMGWDIAIPPGEARHEETAYFRFDREAEIYSLFPHAHYRGHSTRFDIEYPDGKREPLLHVPRYDFNWQHTYTLAEPLTVPAGSRIVHTSVYDNSARNPANPDPERTVPWGLQSHDEMLYGGFFFRWTEGTAETPVHDQMAFEINQFFGALDDNFDGVMQQDEMPRRLGEAFGAGRFDSFNADKDDGLSPAEYRAYVEYRRKQRAQQAAAGD